MDLMGRIDKLEKRGIRVTLDWVNQIENGQAKRVESGEWPLWTCTATAWHTIQYKGKEIEDALNAISADSIPDAFEGLLELIGEEEA